MEVLLANASADVNAAGPNGTWPLLVAVEDRDLELAGLLLSMGADPNKALPTRETLLLRAVKVRQCGRGCRTCRFGCGEVGGVEQGWAGHLVV